MKRFNKYLSIFILIICVLGSASWLIRIHALSTTSQKNSQLNKVELRIIDGSNSESFDISPYIGKSALEATKFALNGNVETNGTGINAFVLGLNGRDADSKKHEFWELDVNGVQSQVGAGSYVIKSGDIVAWRINTY